MEIKKISEEDSYNEYSLLFHDSLLVLIGVEKGVGVLYFSNYADSLVQKLHFHDNGLLAAKTNFDSSDNIQGGRYFFFESNGNISGNFNYWNNNRVGIAKTYYPNVHYLKEYMEYDSIGNLHYRRSYDELGNTIKEEGE